MARSVNILPGTREHAPAWRALYERIPERGAYHDPEYVLTLATSGLGEPELFAFEDQGETAYYPYFKRSLDDLPAASALGLTGYCDIVSSWYYGGPLTSSVDPAFLDAFSASFDEACRDRGVVSEFVRFDPHLENHCLARPPTEVIQNREVVGIDLTLSEDDFPSILKKRFAKGYRPAMRKGASVRFDGGEEDLKRFTEIYAAEMERKDAPAGYLFSREFFRRLLARRFMRLVTVSVEGRVVGGGILALGPKVAHDYLRATLPEYWNMRVNEFLILSNMLRLKEEGYALYDLQGGRPGVYEFKRSFSDLTRPFFVGRAVRIPEIYAELAAASPHGGDFFPAYRQNEKN